MNGGQVSKVGRYETLAKVGQGAMGVVYRAQDPTIRRVVALKVLPADPEPAKQASAAQGRSTAGLFEREAQAAGALLHPNIVTLYDAGRDGSWYYLAMEFIEGDTFAVEIAREGKVEPARAANVVAVVAEALDFAHERGVVHRDIKPANLMILADQTVKVADFGIARLSSTASTLTSDLMIGTPHYMSPEQVSGGQIDGRSDLFSLGVVLYEALTGRKPFQAETLAAVLHSIMSSSPPPAHDVDSTISPELSAIVARAMARNPADRYARGRDMAADLRRFLASAQGDLGPAAFAKPRRRPWLVPAVSTALVLAVGAAFVAVRGIGGTGDPGARPPAKATAIGYLEFVSEPPDAEIFVDGNVIGRTPYTSEVTAGKHEIEFRKPGYYPASQSTNVGPNQRVVIELPMLARKEG
ncbi:MAG: serine/threonine-protein kinase [Candidatus Binatia bacterium]